MNTFLEYMFCNENTKIENNADISPKKLNSSSVTEEMATPRMIGIKDR